MGIATAGISIESCAGTAVAAGSMIAALLAAQKAGDVPVPPIIVDALMESSRSGRPLGTVLEDYAKSEAEAVDAAIESLVAMSHSSDEKEREYAGRLIAQIGVSSPLVKNFKMKKLRDAEENQGSGVYPYVKDYLIDPDIDVQICAIELLGRVGKWNSDAIGQLQRIKSAGTSERVEEALDNSIHSLEGRKPSGIPEAGFYVAASATAAIRFPNISDIGNIFRMNPSATAGFTGSLGYNFPLKWESCKKTFSEKHCNDECSQLRLSGNLTYERRGMVDYFFTAYNSSGGAPTGGLPFYCCPGAAPGFTSSKFSDSHDVGGYIDTEYRFPVDEDSGVAFGGGLIAPLVFLGMGQFKQALFSLLNFSAGYKRAYMDGYAARYGDQEILQLGFKGLRLEKEFGYGFGVKLAGFDLYYAYLLNHKKEAIVEEGLSEHEQEHNWGWGFSVELFFRPHNQ